MEPSPSCPPSALNRLFIKALLHLDDVGETDAACRLAAQGWSLLRYERPREAERLNGVLHNLTNPKRNSRKESPISDKPTLSTSTRKETQS